MTNTKRKNFTPKPRGHIAEALSEKTFSKVAPESPRPAALLENVSITSVDNLTANDSAIYELLLARAHELDTGLLKAKLPLADTHFIPVEFVLEYVGSSARREAVKASMRRLANTTMTFGSRATRLYEDVQMVMAWFESDDRGDNKICFTFPQPIRDAMRSKAGYAYIELAPLADMKSRYSIRLYKRLALEASKVKWEPGAANEVFLSGTPEEVAAWAGYQPESGVISMSKLRDRVLRFVDSDFANLRAFSVTFREHYGSGRGRPVERIEFRLGLKAPSHHLTRVTYEKGEHRERGIGGVDDPRYRVNSNIWIKVQNTFWNVQKRKHDLYFHAWLVALQEALDEEPVSPGYTQRQYRGHRLLKAISSLGPDEAAFKFCAEEVASPDILEDNPVLLSVDPTEAIEARKQRIEASKYARAKTHTSSDQLAVETSKKVDGVRCDHMKGVTSTSNRGFSRPAPVAQSSVVEQVSFIEDAGDVAVSDLDAELLGDLISGDDKPEVKTTVVEVAEEPVDIAQTAEDDAFEILADDLGVDETDAEMLADLIDEPRPEAQTVSLETASEVIWTADRGMYLEEVQEQVFPVIQNHDFAGPFNVKLAVRCWVDGSVEEFSFGKHDVSKADITEITRQLANARVLDDDFLTEEYVR